MLDRHEQPEERDSDVRPAGHGVRDVGGERRRDGDERRARCRLRRGVRGVVRRGNRRDANALRLGTVGRSLLGARRLRRADEPCEVRDGVDRGRAAFARSARGGKTEGIDRRQPAGNLMRRGVRCRPARRSADDAAGDPRTGMGLRGWSGSCRGVAPSCDVVARAAASVVAAFVEAGTRFPVAVTKIGQGTVTSEPAGIDCGRACSRAFPAGSTVTVEAAPKKASGRSCAGTEPARAQDDVRDRARRREGRVGDVGRVADPTPPRVKALASSGELGRIAQLRYRVVEASGRERETVTIFRGTRRLDTWPAAAHRRPGCAVLLHPLASTARGNLRFCVVSTDTAGNRSKPSCAPLHIT